MHEMHERKTTSSRGIFGPTFMVERAASFRRCVERRMKGKPIMDKAISSLRRLGDDLMFFPSMQGLCVRACNMTRTAAGSVFFEATFFGEVTNPHQPERDQRPCCRLRMREFLAAMKRDNAHATLKFFKLYLDTEAEEVAIEVERTDAVHKVTHLRQLDVLQNTVPRLVQRQPHLSRFVADARTLLRVIRAFGPDTVDIGLYASNDHILFFNLPINYAQNKKRVRSCIPLLNTNECRIERPALFQFSSKVILGVCGLGVDQNCEVEMCFDRARNPLFVVVDVPGICECIFTLSTTPLPHVDSEQLIHQIRPDIVLEFEQSADVTGRNRTVQIMRDLRDTIFSPEGRSAEAEGRSAEVVQQGASARSLAHSSRSLPQDAQRPLEEHEPSGEERELLEEMRPSGHEQLSAIGDQSNVEVHPTDERSAEWAPAEFVEQQPEEEGELPPQESAVEEGEITEDEEEEEQEEGELPDTTEQPPETEEVEETEERMETEEIVEEEEEQEESEFPSEPPEPTTVEELSEIPSEHPLSSIFEATRPSAQPPSAIHPVEQAAVEEPQVEEQGEEEREPMGNAVLSESFTPEHIGLDHPDVVGWVSRHNREFWARATEITEWRS
ncbi:hypothetical protein M3Y99_01042800 [Aphelenchoides fujianensis]|nr:hypothetical protein M3Y99_01042800 [Aphelenchoides fujianensis]